MVKDNIKNSNNNNNKVKISKKTSFAASAASSANVEQHQQQQQQQQQTLSRPRLSLSESMDNLADQIDMEMKKKDDILQCFYDIVSADESTRIRGISTLILTLTELQEDFKPEDHSSVLRYVPKVMENRIKDLNPLFSPELNYSIQRLVGGLASTRDITKMGFSLALSELLNALPVISISWFIRNLVSSMDITGASGFSEREALFGRMFGLMAVIKSGRIDQELIRRAPTKSSIYNADQPDTDNIVEALLEQLIYISKKRAQYTELAYEVITALTEQISTDNFDKLLPFIKPLIPENINDYSPDLILLILSLSHRYKKFKLLKHTNGWSHSSLFNQSNLQFLKIIYSKSVSTHPRVHKVWPQTFAILLQNLPENISIIEFWKKIVENNLFTSTSQIKKSLGLQLFEILLPMLPATSISEIFTVHLNYYLNQSLQSDNVLHEVGVQVFQIIPKTAEISKEHRLQLALYFSGNGSKVFQNPIDIINELIRDMDVESMNKYINTLFNAFYDPDVSVASSAMRVEAPQDNGEEPVESETDNEQYNEEQLRLLNARTWVLSQLGYIVKELLRRPMEAVISQQPKILNILKFLYFQAFFLPKEKVATKSKQTEDAFLKELQSRQPSFDLQQKTRDQCGSKLLSVLESLSHHNLVHQPLVDGVMGNGEFWVSEVVKFQNQVRATHSLSTPLPIGFKQLDKVTKVITVLQQNPVEKRSVQTRAFELLFLHVSLQYLFEPSEISELLDDLISAYEELIGLRKAKKNGPNAFMILVDILISLLDKPQALLRSVVKLIFSIFSEDITFPVLEHILNTISAPITEIFDGMDEDDDEDDDEFEPINGDDDEEEDDGEEDESESADGEEENEEEEEEEEDDDDDDDDEVDPEIVARIKKSLGPHLLLEDDDEMDDAKPPTAKEARQLDNYLEQIFRRKKEEKAKFNNLKTKTMTLKIRLIDLVEIYIKRSTAPNSIFFQALPLMINAANSEEPSISNRFLTIFKNKISTIKKCADNVDVKSINALIKSCIDTIKTSLKMKSEDKKNKPFLFLLSGHTVFMCVRVMLAMNKLDSAALDAELTQLLQKENIANKNNTVILTFITEFSQRFPQLMSGHVTDMMKVVGGAGANEYVFKKLLEIIGVMIPKRTQHDSAGATAGLIEVFPAIVATLIDSIADSLKSKKYGQQQAILLQLANIFNFIISHQSVDKIKSKVDSAKINETLEEVCKVNGKRAIKDHAKRIVKLLEIDSSELLALSKRKRKQLEREEKLAENGEVKKSANNNILTVHNAKRDKPQSKSTQVKVDNKNKSRPKKKEEETDEAAQLYKELQDPKEEETRPKKKVKSKK